MQYSKGYAMRFANNALFLSAATALLSGCYFMEFDEGSDDLDKATPIVTDWTATDSFSGVNVRGPDKVIIETGDSFRIKAEGDAGVLKGLRFRVADGKIVIGRKSGSNAWKGATATIMVTAPTLSTISLAGSGDIEAAALTGKDAKLSIAGSGNADIAAVDAESLNVSIAGSGRMKLSGKAASAKYSIAGSGGLDAITLASRTAKISIAGSGSATLNATETVDAKIAGSGNVKVSGGAKCTKSVSGSGTLDCG
jgi:hypothetical protein